MKNDETLPIQYKNYTISKSDREGDRYMAYPTEIGIDHDADFDGDRYKYTGNCLYSSHIENLKAEIDEKQPEDEPRFATGGIVEGNGKVYKSTREGIQEFGHNLQEEARTYNAMKTDLEAFLMKYMEVIGPRTTEQLNKSAHDRFIHDLWTRTATVIEMLADCEIKSDDRFKERN